jgi:glycosyltransferase involved in cell wall biosynthesis/exopolysaccharide biosynthesis predicted pyruvyltransferase EpsI
LTDIEIITVNDGSTDGSPDILKEYAEKDNRIKIIDKENGGLSTARNAGLAKAQGTYILFVDSDDWVEPDLAKEAVAKAEETDAEITIFFTKVEGTGSVWQSENDWFKYMISSMSLDDKTTTKEKESVIYYVAAWAKLYRTDFIRENNLRFPDGLVWEDAQFAFQSIVLAKRISIAPIYGYHYRIRSGSILTSGRNGMDIVEIYNNIGRFLTENGYYDEWRDLFIRRKLGSFRARYNSTDKDLHPVFLQAIRNALTEDDWFAIRHWKAGGRGFWCLQQFGCFYERFYATVLLTGYKTLRFLKRMSSKYLKKLSRKIKRSPTAVKELLLASPPKLPPLPVVTFSQGNIFSDEPLVKELPKRFTFFPNQGNLGDVLIAQAEYQFFDANGLDYEIDNGKNVGENLVYGGGGKWHPHWKNTRYGWREVLEVFKNPAIKNIVILPSSFYDVPELLEILDERFTVFCREQQSFDYLTAANTAAKIILDHDMALRLTDRFEVPSRFPFQGDFCGQGNADLQQVNEIDANLQTRGGQKIAYFLRTDNESNSHWDSQVINIVSTMDLSPLHFSGSLNRHETAFYAQLFLTAVNKTDIVITDRLHVGIAAVLLGKEVFLVDNSYGKVGAVYRQSLLSHQRVHWCGIAHNVRTELDKYLSER